MRSEATSYEHNFSARTSAALVALKRSNLFLRCTILTRRRFAPPLLATLVADLTAFLSQAIEGEETSTQSSTRSNAGGIDRLHFEKGNRVIISSDATIFDCGEKSTSVGGRHELHIVLAEIVSTGRDFVSVRCSKAYAEKLKRFTDKWQKLDDSKSISVKFRIDLNEWGGGMGIFRENLMKLFRLNTMRPSYGLSVSESAREGEAASEASRG